MPLDPGIPLSVKPPAMPNPLEIVSAIAQLQGVREQTEARRAAVEERRQAGEERRQKAADEAAKRQREQAVEARVHAAIRPHPTTGQPTIDWPTLLGSADVPPDVLFKLGEETDQAAQRLATLESTNLDISKKKTLMLGALARPVAASGHAKPAWDAALLAAYNKKLITAEERDAGYAITDPAAIKQATDNAIREASEAEPAAAGSFEDYVQRVTATSGAPPTPADVLTMRRDWEAAGRAPEKAGGGTKFQDVDAIVKTPDGRTYVGKVGYNPDANVYAPIGSTEPFPPGTKVEKQPTPVDPMVAAIRGLTVQTLQQQAATMTPAQFSAAKSLADDYTKASEDYIIRAQSHQTLKGAADNPSAAGDIVMIFAFMRQQDPRSTVREGEFATAQNAAGVPEQIRNLYNRVLSGERLSPAQRADFVAQSGRIFSEAQKRQRGLYDIYSQRARNMRLKPEDVVIDYDQLFGVPPPPPATDPTKPPGTTPRAAPKTNPFR